MTQEETEERLEAIAWWKEHKDGYRRGETRALDEYGREDVGLLGPLPPNPFNPNTAEWEGYREVALALFEDLKDIQPL